MENIAHWVSSQFWNRKRGDLQYIPLWNPYIFSCRTKEEIFVCLKYCLCLNVSLLNPNVLLVRGDPLTQELSRIRMMVT